jgi:hypothetical protein
MNTQPTKKVRAFREGWDSLGNVMRQPGEIFDVPAFMTTEGSSWLEEVEPSTKPHPRTKTDSDLV